MLKRLKKQKSIYSSAINQIYKAVQNLSWLRRSLGGEQTALFQQTDAALNGVGLN